MAQIREIKKRIKSIENTKKVTHAMELVAAAKMRKAQTAALSGRPYTVTLNQIIDEVRQKTDETTHTLLKKKQAQGQIIILVASDRGLAGGLNINLFREIIHLRGEKSSHLGGENRNSDIQFITVGKKATNFAARSGAEIIASFTSEEKSPLELARILAKMATDAFIKSETNKVSLLYPHFESTTNQVPMWVQILPIEFENGDQSAHLRGETRRGLAHLGGEDKAADILLFEPNVRKILNGILPHHVLTRIYQILLEAKASEHSARMVAMKNATDAAGDLIEDLTLTYNQARQEAITKELLDIVTAQKAFE